MNHSDFFVNRRIATNLSQSKIGEILGYSSQSVSAWESGRSFPDLSIWSKYASLLGVDLDGFINAKENKANDRCETYQFDSDKFSNNIKYLRKKNNLTLNDLSKSIGINVKTISAWEQAKSYPNLSSFIKLCSIYKLKYDELYFVIKLDEINETKKKKKKIFLPIFLPIIITLGVGGGTTIGVVTYNQRNALLNSTYKISWCNYDGNVLNEEIYKYGDTPTYKGETPKKPSTLEYSYDFLTWSPEIEKVYKDQSYTAVFKENKDEFIGGDGTLTIDYMIDEINQDHIYDINNPEGLSIVLNNNNNLEATKIDLKVDDIFYSLDKSSFKQDKDILTIDKSFFANLYQEYGYNSFIRLSKVTYLDENNQEDIAVTLNDYFEFGVVSSDDITYVNQYSDFEASKEYKYYLLNKDIDIPPNEFGLDVRGVINGNGYTIGNVSVNKVDRVENLFEYGVFSTFKGIIHNLKVKDINIHTKVIADDASHIASLIGAGEDYTLSKVDASNINIKIDGGVSDIFASIMVGCSVNGSLERVSISDSSIIVNGENSRCSVTGFVSRSPTSTNYSIRDCILKSSKIYLNSDADWCLLSYVSETFVHSIKRVIVYDSELECHNNRALGYGGFIYENGKEIESALFLKNDTRFDHPGDGGIMTNGSNIRITSSYYSSDNITLVPKRDESRDGVFLENLSSLSTSNFYRSIGYRNINWDLSNLGQVKNYMPPTLR